MVIVAELITLPVINEYQSHIITNMPVSYHIHIVKESKISKYANEKFIRESKRCSHHS